MPPENKTPPEDVGAPSNGAADDSVYDPSTIEVNRGREQGLGMGAADLARQREPSAMPALPVAEDEEPEV